MQVEKAMKTTTKALLTLCLLMAAPGAVPAQESYRLVSAQVVTASEGPPVLKLSANGPFAFAVVADDPAPASPQALVARLYGVSPGEAGVTGALWPFAVTLRAEGSDTVITVAMAGATLRIKSASRANEVEVFAGEP